MISSSYEKAVNEFVFGVEDFELPISKGQVDEVIREIRSAILSVSDQRFPEATFRDTLFFCASLYHERKGQVDVAEKIAGASEKAKKVVAHIFEELKTQFIRLTDDDVKAAILLFGIYPVNEALTSSSKEIPPLLVQKMAMLEQLITMRKRYPQTLSEGSSKDLAILAQIDAQIKRTQDEIEAEMKASS